MRWRDLLLILSAFWIFSAIQVATHPNPAPISLEPSHTLVLKADAPSHSTVSAQHSVPPLTFVPATVLSELRSHDAPALLCAEQAHAAPTNYRLIRTGLSPPAASALG